MESARIGRYDVLRRLGAGGMGAVFEATARGLHGQTKRVAVKVIRPGHDDNPQAIERFVAEAKLSFVLSHANLVQTFDVGQLDDRYFIAMELVDGTDLRKLLRSAGPLSVPIAVTIATEMLKGLDYLHRFTEERGRPLGLVHRDVSPANVLLSTEGEVKVADFGVARATLSYSSPQDIAGKLRYMAPEQLEGADLDRRADVYAVGVVLYEMLTRRRPFAGDDGAVLGAILAGDFEPARAHRADLTDALDAIVSRALALRPDDRFESAAQMREALEGLALEQGWLLSTGALATFVQERPREVAADGDDGGMNELLGAQIQPTGVTGSVGQFTASLAPAVTAPTTPAGPRRVSVAAGAARARSSRLPWIALAVVAAAIGVGVGAAQWGASPQVAAPAASSRRAAPAPAAPPSPAQKAAPAPQPAPDPEPPAEPPTEVEPEPATASGRRTRRARASPPNPETAPSEGIAHVSVNSDPWSEVRIDGQLVGNTPLVSHALPAGSHVLDLRNPESGAQARRTIELADGQSRRVFLPLVDAP